MAGRGLLGVAYFTGLLAAAGGVLCTRQPGDAPTLLAWAGASFALGACLALLQPYPPRAFGILPFVATGTLAGLVWAACAADGRGPSVLMGGMLGLLLAPVRAVYRLGAAGGTSSGRMLCVGLAAVLGVAGATLLAVFAASDEMLGRSTVLWILAGLTGAGAAVAWWRLYVESLEQTAEILLWPIYRVRGYGPGIGRFPLLGPVLIVSNHTAWFDPLWIGKVVPRHIIPMMGSAFYDLPVMRWVMVHIVRAIRVEEKGFRREAPELDEAVAALDRGECVVLFPEGRVRRKEEEPLRQFGQGVVHILRQRPQTPVVVCWIEGGWGSFTSYWKGPPAKNKRFDWWRTIRLGMSEPQVLDAALLEDQRATRAYLMRECLEARRHLGLAPLAPQPPSEEERSE